MGVCSRIHFNDAKLNDNATTRACINWPDWKGILQKLMTMHRMLRNLSSRLDVDDPKEEDDRVCCKHKQNSL
jgi:hypothetical protein